MKRFTRRIGDAADGPGTFIAKSATIEGKIRGKGKYVVCGNVQGDCDIEGPVTLAQEGHWKGELRAQDVVIAGHVEGDVFARERVEIAGTATVSGSISGHSIAVAVGAIIEGEINVTSGKEPIRFKEKRGSSDVSD